MLGVKTVTGLNLARKPFANRRPVLRAAAVFWSLAAVVLAFDLWFWWQLRSSSSEGRGELASVRQQIEAEVAHMRELDSRLDAFTLDEQNDQVEFLNQKIEERIFSWSQLFDDLAAALPARVRLASLTPQIIEPDLRRRRRRRATVEPRDRWVNLEMTAEAETDEGILASVEALFEHPAFRSPNLRSEARQPSGTYRFALSVQYLPSKGRAEPEQLGPAGGSGEPGDAAGTMVSTDVEGETATEPVPAEETS